MLALTRICAATLVAAGIAVPGIAVAGYESTAREIAAAFQEHGMETRRAQCFAMTIVRNLPDNEYDAAARIVREAESEDDIRLGVIQAGGNMVGAFTMADTTCRRA